MKVAKVFRLWIEDSDLHDLLDEFKKFMDKERGNRLKKSKKE